MATLTKLAAFFLRDLGIAATYRVTFAQSFAMLFLGLVSMQFVARFINEGAPPSLAGYDNDYFGFALVGMSTAFFVQTMVSLFPNAIRGAQTTGTLEVILASRTSIPVFLSGSVMYGLAFAGVRLAAAIFLGGFVLGARIHLDQALTALAALLLTAAVFAGIGLIAASFVVWFKQQEPFTGMFLTLSLLVSGVLYPATVLPGWLELVSKALPLTHAVAVLRASLLLDRGFRASGGELAILAGFALLLPLGLAAFAWSVRRAQMSGTLGHY